MPISSITSVAMARSTPRRFMTSPVGNSRAGRKGCAQGLGIRQLGDLFRMDKARDLDSLHPGRQGALDEGQLLRGRDGLSLVL